MKEGFKTARGRRWEIADLRVTIIIMPALSSLVNTEGSQRHQAANES